MFICAFVLTNGQDKRMIVILHKNSFMFGDCNPDFRANNPIFRPLLHVIA